MASCNNTRFARWELTRREKAQAFGDKSKANLARIVFNKDVDVEWNKPDRYHRIVGTIKVQPTD